MHNKLNSYEKCIAKKNYWKKNAFFPLQASIIIFRCLLRDDFFVLVTY